MSLKECQENSSNILVSVSLAASAAEERGFFIYLFFRIFAFDLKTEAVDSLLVIVVFFLLLDIWRDKLTLRTGTSSYDYSWH